MLGLRRYQAARETDHRIQLTVRACCRTSRSMLSISAVMRMPSSTAEVLTGISLILVAQRGMAIVCRHRKGTDLEL